MPIPASSAPFMRDALKILPSDVMGHVTWEEICGKSTGKGVKVAVIDSGVDSTHPALKGSVQGYVSIQQGSGGFVYDTEPHEDFHGHGTACAGIIRAVAPDCEIYSVKVLGKWLTGSGNIFIEGLRWAIEHGMHVCNLSLGTTKKEYFGALHEIVDQAYFRRITFVTAANNLNIPSFPSVYSSVISVASHSEQNTSRFYYNPDPPVEFGALGIDVRVAWLDHKWITATGNSFAAPHITGMVARLLEKHPGLTPFQVKAILRALAANVVHPINEKEEVPGREE